MNIVQAISAIRFRGFYEPAAFQRIIRAVIWLSFMAGAGTLIIKFPAWLALTTAAGVPILYFLLTKPEIGVLAIVAVVASIVFEAALPLIPIPGGSLHLTDIVLFGLLGVIVFGYLLGRVSMKRKTPLDLPLILFYLASIISAALSFFGYGLDFNTVTRGLRSTTYYLLFFAVTRLIREKRQIRFVLFGLFGIASFVSLAMIVQAVIGEAVHLMPGRVESARTNSVAFDATRILPPGETLILVMFIVCVCTIVLLRKPLVKSGFFYIILLIGTGILLTYNRNFWGAIASSLTLLVFLISSRSKKRFFCWLALIALIAAFSVPLFRSGGERSEAYYDSIIARFSTMLSLRESFGSSSYNWRKVENKYALDSIARHPWLGIGLRNSYRPRLRGMDDVPNSNMTRYIHNAYLWVLVDMGLFGFIPLIWFYSLFLVRGFLNWRKTDDNFERTTVIGLTLAGVALAISALFAPWFMEWPAIVMIAVITGLTESILQLNKRDRCESTYSFSGLRVLR